MKTVFISISKSDCFTARFERKARRIRRVVCVRVSVCPRPPPPLSEMAEGGRALPLM